MCVGVSDLTRMRVYARVATQQLLMQLSLEIHTQNKSLQLYRQLAPSTKLTDVKQTHCLTICYFTCSLSLISAEGGEREVRIASRLRNISLACLYKHSRICVYPNRLVEVEEKSLPKSFNSTEYDKSKKLRKERILTGSNGCKQGSHRY